MAARRWQARSFANPSWLRPTRALLKKAKSHFTAAVWRRKSWTPSRTQGGIIDAEDLANYEPTWKEPLGIDYRGYSINCPPPNCSGWQYLQAFKMLESFDLAAMGQNSVETLHTLAEVFKIAVADRIAYTTNPNIDLEALLSEDIRLPSDASWSMRPAARGSKVSDTAVRGRTARLRRAILDWCSKNARLTST